MTKPQKTILPDQAFVRVAHICSQKECCVYDIKRKLNNMGLSEAEIDKIIEKLVTERYIDEERFARNFISDKLRFNKWGELKIRQALRQKFVPKAVVERVFSEIENDSLTEKLPDLLMKKRKSITGNCLTASTVSEYEINTKLIRYAMGKGFTMSDVLKCLKSMNINNLPDED